LTTAPGQQLVHNGTPVPHIAPEDPTFFENAADSYDWLLEHAPVYWRDARPHYPRPFWVVSRWTDGYPLLHDIDPPEHVRHRRLINRAFTGQRVTDLEPRVCNIVLNSLAKFDPTQAFDAVETIAASIPLIVICELLGLPREDLAMFRHWSDEIARSVEVDGPNPIPLLIEVFDYLGAVVEQRRGDARDDLITALVNAELGGDRLSAPEVMMHCWSLLVAGNETTRNAIAGSLEAFAAHPGEWNVMRSKPELLDGAVAEMLRWVTPVRYNCRTALRDVSISGTNISEGDFVLMLYSAANRDGSVWQDPHRLDIARVDSAPHLSFGYGQHGCLGDQLAHLEIRIIFEELSRRYETVEMAGPAQRQPHSMLNQFLRLPVRLRLPSGVR
jgi:cholest-4-en-3-one 26-monooxygenase